jgi:hypothetical protein
MVVDNKLTRRENFLKLIKMCDICIAEVGLHQSIGWKFAEYVAASRAIITEPINYSLSGTFKRNINYLEFNSIDDLIESVNLLFNNQHLRENMMKTNEYYYNRYVRADKLILNTLIEASIL